MTELLKVKFVRKGKGDNQAQRLITLAEMNNFTLLAKEMSYC